MRSPPRWAPRILSDSRRLTTDAGRITFPLGITMKILSLKLPASLDAELEAAAARRRTTKSALLREALASYLAREAGAPQASEIPRRGPRDRPALLRRRRGGERGAVPPPAPRGP